MLFVQNYHMNKDCGDLLFVQELVINLKLSNKRMVFRILFFYFIFLREHEIICNYIYNRKFSCNYEVYKIYYNKSTCFLSGPKD